MLAALIATPQVRIGRAWTWEWWSALSAPGFTGILEAIFQGGLIWCQSLGLSKQFSLQGKISWPGWVAPWPHGSNDLYGQLHCQLPLGGKVRIWCGTSLWWESRSVFSVNFCLLNKTWASYSRLQPGLKKPGPDTPREEKERFIKAKWESKMSRHEMTLSTL